MAKVQPISAYVAADKLDGSRGHLAAPSTLMHVRSAVHDPDQLLIEQMLEPPPLEDAQASLEYWQARRKRLPLYQRSARREAKEMTVRWQERVRAAELARFEASPIGRLFARLGISSIWFRRVQLTSQLLSWVVWAVVLRKVKLVLGSFALIGVLIVVLLVVVIAQLT